MFHDDPISAARFFLRRDYLQILDFLPEKQKDTNRFHRLVPFLPVAAAVAATTTTAVVRRNKWSLYTHVSYRWAAPHRTYQLGLAKKRVVGGT